MNFLPENYEAPKSNNQSYFKPLDGENRIRILSKPLLGWIDWTLEKKPVRYAMDEKPMKSIDPKKPLKHFWAFIIWNIQAEQIQIMEITQATIKSSLEALCKDSDWGSPFAYDIKIIKKGEGIETEYSVNPAPHKPVTQEILQAFSDRPINLEALFESGDPFAQGWDSYTKLMSDEEPEKKELIISDDQFVELSELLNGCADAMQQGFKEYLKKAFNISTLYNLEEKHYAKMKNDLTVRYNENQKSLVEAEMADTPASKGKK